MVYEGASRIIFEKLGEKNLSEVHKIQILVFQKNYLSSGGSNELINELSEIKFDDSNGQNEIENPRNEIKKISQNISVVKGNYF